MTSQTTPTKVSIGSTVAFVALVSIASAQLPDPGMTIDPANTAIVITDPQNDFLSPDGVTWGVVGKNVEANNTVENLETLFKLGKQYGLQVFVSPHYYYPTDHGWKFEGALEALMHSIGMFDRKGPLSLSQFNGSCTADQQRRFKGVFQVLDLLAHRRRGHKKLGSRLLDAQVSGRCLERPQSVQRRELSVHTLDFLMIIRKNSRL